MNDPSVRLAATTAGARLRGDRSQQVFDALLRSLAEPGTIRRLPDLPAAVPAPAWLAIALADVDVSVAVVGPGCDAVADLVVQATDAPLAPVSEASIVVCTASPGLSLLDEVNVGTALAPELGARLAVPVDGLAGDGFLIGGSSAGRPAVDVTLEGPGVRDSRRVTIAGLAGEEIERFGNWGQRFPQGHDTWLFGPEGTVMAIPRSTVVQLVDSGVGDPGAADENGRR